MIQGKKHSEETKRKMSETKRKNVLEGKNSKVKAVEVFYKGKLFGKFSCMRYAGKSIHKFFIENGIPSTERSAEEGIKRILSGHQPKRGKYSEFTANFIKEVI